MTGAVWSTNPPSPCIRKLSRRIHGRIFSEARDLEGQVASILITATDCDEEENRNASNQKRKSSHPHIPKGNPILTHRVNLNLLCQRVSDHWGIWCVLNREGHPVNLERFSSSQYGLSGNMFLHVIPNIFSL